MKLSEKIRRVGYRLRVDAKMFGSWADEVEQLEDDNLRFIKANAEVAKINANLVEENEALRLACLEYLVTDTGPNEVDALFTEKDK